MSAKSPHRHTCANVRHLIDERLDLIEAFDTKIREGGDRRDIASELKVSLPTIYRWKRTQSDWAEEKSKSYLDPIDIDEVIEILSDPKINEKSILLNAFFQLVVWMNFPLQDEHHSVGVAVCTIRYLATDVGSKKLSEIDSELASLVTDKINIRTLQKICDYGSSLLPNFDVWPIDNQPYDEIDYFAEIARILIEYNPSSKDQRDAASLSKARYALYRGAFSYNWKITPETFRVYWSKYGSSSPFLYVRRYYMKNFVIDPNDRDFAESADQIIDDRSQTILFLKQCKTAVEAFQNRLDRRALSKLRLPNFPLWLEPAPLPKAPFPPGAKLILQSYGRADKR